MVVSHVDFAETKNVSGCSGERFFASASYYFRMAVLLRFRATTTNVLRLDVEKPKRGRG